VTAQAGARIIAAMASRMELDYNGLRIVVKPDYWLRRRLPFLPFLETTNPRFRIDVKRVAPPDPPWQSGEQLVFRVVFPDKTTTPYPFPVPSHLTQDGRTSFVIPKTICPSPGRMAIIFPLVDPPGSFNTMYSYTVHAEERLWYPIFASVFTLVGVALQRFLLS
jgi:hypothetical protein